MSKITLLPVCALLMIFPLFWGYGNAAIFRKLGVRHNAVTSLPNTGDVTFGALGAARKLGVRHNTVTSLPNTGDVAFGGLGAAHKLGIRHNAVTSLPKIGDVTFGGLGPAHKLGERQNAVTSWINTNEATFGGLEDQDFAISSSLDHGAYTPNPRTLGPRQSAIACLKNTNCAISGRPGHFYAPILSSSVHANTVRPRILGSHQNAITSFPNIGDVTFGGIESARTLGVRHNAVTSLMNTNEVTFGGSQDLDSPISSLLAHEAHTTTPSQLEGRQSEIACSKNIVCEILGGRKDFISTISSSSDHANLVTPHKLGSLQNAIARMPNTNEATSGGSADSNSPISSSSAHSNAIIVPYPDPTIFTNEAIARKPGTRQNPIIVTSLPSTKKAVNPHESRLHFFPISSSPTQTNVVFPREAWAGHSSSIIN